MPVRGTLPWFCCVATARHVTYLPHGRYTRRERAATASAALWLRCGGGAAAAAFALTPSCLTHLYAYHSTTARYPATARLPRLAAPCRSGVLHTRIWTVYLAYLPIYRRFTPAFQFTTTTVRVVALGCAFRHFRRGSLQPQRHSVIAGIFMTAHADTYRADHRTLRAWLCRLTLRVWLRAATPFRARYAPRCTRITPRFAGFVMD